MLRIVPSVVGLLVALVVALGTAAPVSAQVDLCGHRDVGTAPGTTVCASPALTATATVRSVVVLTLDEVFGAPAAALTIGFGDVDAQCAAMAVSGVSCTADPAGTSAVWHGPVRFSVRMGGARGASGPVTARLTGRRGVAETLPNNRLLDGAAGAVPATPYRNAGIDLRTGIPNGRTVVARSIGVRVNANDAPGVWTARLVYDVVME